MCCARADACSSAEQAQQLHRDLLDGMHAMAQPLTMLESRVYLALAQSGLPSEIEAVLVRMEDDLQQLCGPFQSMQRLLHLQSTPAALKGVSACSLAALLAEAAEIAFAGSRIAVRFQLVARREQETPAKLLCLDPLRMREAMTQLCVIASELAATEVLLACREVNDDAGKPCGLELVFAPDLLPPTQPGLEEQKTTDGLNERLRLRLALAREGLRSQGCALSMMVSPPNFRVEVPFCD